MLYDIIFAIIALALVIWLWPIIKWLALIMLIMFAIFVIRVVIETKKAKKEIQKDPQSYYNKTNNVIDAQYTEKEVSKEEE